MTELPHDPSCRWLQPCETAVHAEANAIAFAARSGVSTDRTTLYTLFAPCRECARLIVNAGITRVVAVQLHGTSPNSLVGSGLYVLEGAGITVDYAVGGDMVERTS
jgi:dCMP deaminase